MILIIAPRDDLHARCVAQDLRRRGRPFRIADSSQLDRGGCIQFRPGDEQSSRWLSIDGEPIALEEVQAVWHRRRPLPPSPEHLGFAERSYHRREWTEFLSGVLASMNARFINDPARHEAATKPLQLHLASRVGLRVPDTLITNDPAAAADFVDRHRGDVIHKSISPPRHRFLPTKRWSEADRQHLPNLRVAPTIFQEAIAGRREVRITVIGERAYAAAFCPRAELVDGRLDYDSRYEPHELPVDVEERLLGLMRRLGLVFCTADMKLTDDGEYVFLDLNPMGQYLYVEILSGLPLTEKMAAFLAA